MKTLPTLLVMVVAMSPNGAALAQSRQPDDRRLLDDPGLGANPRDGESAGRETSQAVQQQPPSLGPAPQGKDEMPSRQQQTSEPAPARPGSPRDASFADDPSGERERGQRRVTRRPRTRNEFERFVARVVGRPLSTFGEDLVTGELQTFAPDAQALVPPDYVLQIGDELLVRTTGAYQENLRVFVDRAGQIYLPRVGAVPVAGVRVDQLQPLLEERIGMRYRGFELSVVVGRLRGVRVYVTGFATRPGAYTLGSLSTLVNAVIAAGGPSHAGSLRDVELRRGSQLVTRLDLYDLLIGGDKRADAVLQSEDVIRVGPVGPQVAIFGSVNAPAIYEAKPGETLADLVRFAGGLSSVADETRFAVERLANRSATVIEELPFSSSTTTPLARGDVFRLFSVTDVALPLDRQAKLVRIDGEVTRPGDYYMPPGSTLTQLVERAGGVTPRAFVFGAEFMRESVRVQQQLGYDRAIDEFEQSVTTAVLTTRVTAEDAGAHAQRLESMTRLLGSLRTLRPRGRVVLALSVDAKTLPEMPLENGDRLYVPPVPTIVQVFGSVFNPGSFAYAADSRLARYLRTAGGPRRGADTGSMFVIRADGSVRSNRQGWRVDVESETALPGDTLFVPEEMDKTTLLQGVKDVSQILFQFGLGAAGLKVLFGL